MKADSRAPALKLYDGQKYMKQQTENEITPKTYDDISEAFEIDENELDEEMIMDCMIDGVTI